MKRMLYFFLIITLLFTGCQKKIRTKEILSDALQYADIPCVRIYWKGAAKGSGHELTPVKTQTLYGCVLRDFAADYAIALTAWDDPAEVHIIKAKNETDALFLEKILLGRLDKLSSAEKSFYRTEKSEEKTGSVEKIGVYVFLIYSENTEKTSEAIRKFF